MLIDILLLYYIGMKIGKEVFGCLWDFEVKVSVYYLVEEDGCVY